jgi:hypothetical protein
VTHLVASAKLGVAGAFSTENTNLIEGSGGTRADHDQTIRRGFNAAFSRAVNVEKVLGGHQCLSSNLRCIMSPSRRPAWMK